MKHYGQECIFNETILGVHFNIDYSNVLLYKYFFFTIQ